MCQSVLTGLLVFLVGVSPLAAQLRQEISLNGPWEVARVADLTAGPPAEGWQPFTVPGTIFGVDYERAWFRRNFVVPESMRGKRMVLHFGGLKFNSVVRVNGQTVGGHFGGYEAFDVDITAAARVGENNRLELGCHDWTGVFVDNETDLSPQARQNVESRNLPRDKVLAPIGGLTEHFGPWDDVLLRAHPPIYVKDLFIKPSVRMRSLRVEYTLENLTATEATVDLGARVDDRGETPLTLAPRQVTIPAGATASAVLQAPWEEPRLWSHEDPYLYFLDTTLTRGGEVLDELRTRFGFREFWVDGPHFVLNGSRISLLATSWWPEIGVTKEHVQRQIRAIKAANCRIFRTHTQPWPQVWYETADEMGLMMIPEGAVWNDDEVYRIDDPRFWDNYADHLRAMVDRMKNHPSVVMYSLENEFFGARMNEASPAKEELVRMGRLVKQWDPTRPIMYESDGDPGGVADVIGIHYPHEYPQFVDWPNTAYWMDTPKNLSGWGFFENARQWVWKRDKPVYIGEFLWVPSSDPSWDTVFFGDEAYTEYWGYHVEAKGEAWRMAIQAYRSYGVGISPWTMVEGGPLDESNAMYAQQKYAMQPIAAYLREYDHNFYGGQVITRTADVYNDVLSPSQLTLTWSLHDDEAELGRGEQRLTMEPAERRAVELALALPQVDTRRDVTLTLRITRAGQEVFSDSKQYSIFPPLRLEPPGGVTVGLYDPFGTTREALAQHGLQTTPVTDLNQIPRPVNVLIVGADALSQQGPARPVIGAPTGERQGLLDWIRNGGRALVLEHSEYPVGVLPVTLVQRSSTMTFPQMPQHPLLRGVRAEDLKWWRPDHRVTAAEPARPVRGAFRAIVVSGGSEGIAHAPLLELPWGNGSLLLCQLKLIGALEQEPAAGLILSNALHYLPHYQPQVARAALFCPDPQTREVLQAIGLMHCTDVTHSPATADWANLDLLIACGPLQDLAQHAPALEQWVAGGGRALLHGVTGADRDLVEELTGQRLELVPYRGPATRIPDAHPLSQFFANEDLYWLGEQQAAYSWATRPLASDVADWVVARSLEGKPVTTYPNDVMRVEGLYGTNGPDGASLPTGSSLAAVQIQVPADGAYLLGVVAGGTQAQGVWPAGTVSVDGKQFGSFNCHRGEPDTYTMSGNLTAGPHEVVIRFTNDAWNPPHEDRNMLIKALLVAPDEASQDVTFLTSAPALVAVRHGQGLVVIDNINWDRTQREAIKASRYICGLLTGLGAQLGSSGAVVLEAETFEPDPNMPWYRQTSSGAYLGASGYLSTPLSCARAGTYRLELLARGTPVGGVYPIIALELDGTPVGEVELKSDGWRRYPVVVELTEGEHTLKLIFTNDEWRPPEDRNLEIDRIEVTEGS